jgi:hypothetical protein
MSENDEFKPRQPSSAIGNLTWGLLAGLGGSILFAVALLVFAPGIAWIALNALSPRGNEPTHSPHDPTPSIVQFFNAAIDPYDAFYQNGDIAKHTCSAFRDQCYSTISPAVTKDPDPASKCSYIVGYALHLGATQFTVGNGNAAQPIDGDNALNACEKTLAVSKAEVNGKSISENFRLTGEWKKLHVSFTVLTYRNEIKKPGGNSAYSYGMTVRTNEFK